MRHLGDWLASLPLPPTKPEEGIPEEAAALPSCGGLAGVESDLVQVLGGGLPGGHLHVWGGPTGAGKTSFLLCLLHGAARRGRRVAYATYDLPASTLALRVLAMECGVPAERMASGRFDGATAARASRGRAGLAGLPFWFLEARGLGVASLEDRVVRMPFRPEVLAVDYLQAIVREPGADLGQALRDLSALASRLHLAVVCALRAEPEAIDAREGDGRANRARDERTHDERTHDERTHDERMVEEQLRRQAVTGAGDRADRVGWIAPAGGSGTRRAEILRNRYGERPALPLRFDPTTGLVREDDDAAASS
jgi:hypothetical protein